MFSELLYISFIFFVGFFLGMIAVGPHSVQKEMELRNKMRRDEIRRTFERQMNNLDL